MNNLNPALQTILVAVILFVLSSIFMSPLFQGKTLVQSDNVQFVGVGKLVADYRAKGEQILWNSREFSGVPQQGPSVLNPFYQTYLLVYLSTFPKPILMIFTLCIGFYLLLRVLGVSRWIACFGAFAFGFSTFNIISIEVGHDYKVLAMAFMAPVLAGVIAAYRGDFLRGGVYTFFFAGFQLYFGHVQITYYLLLMVIAYFLLVLYQTIKLKTWTTFFRASAVLSVATVLAVGCNFQKLYSLIEYADYSTRGGSELKSNNTNVNQTGLSKDYALSWSNGQLETFTLIFPYFHGGASQEALSKNSETYKTLTTKGIDRSSIDNVLRNVPLYWGKQPFTGGPIYFGATVCFLFILGIVVLKGSLKWWALFTTILSLLLAMGKNLEWFTDIFFFHVPLYNKFRSVTMILSIAQLAVPVLAFVMLDKILTEDSFEKIEKKVLQVAGGFLSVGIFFLLFKEMLFEFSNAKDAAYGFPDWLIDAIVSDRRRLFNNDIFRSLLLILILASGLWLYLKKRISRKQALILFGLLIGFDLWIVNTRYVSKEDFKTPRIVSQQIFQPTSADQRILADTDHFRVLNLSTANPYSDGITLYHHSSILGYSAIKMQRYQELIDRYIRTTNLHVLSMLNTKYVIVKGENGPTLQFNNRAYGNVWLTKDIVVAADADGELEALGQSLGKETAVMNKKNENLITQKKFSGEGTIALTHYHPERMQYQFESNANQFATFSEIYYGPGWNAYIDGNLVEHCRVNYVLRGLPIPQGSHEIEFRYEPRSREVGKYVIGSSMVMFLLLLSFSLWQIRETLPFIKNKT